MKFFIVFFLVVPAFAQELWLHRLHEKAAPDFHFSSNCTRAKNLSEIFNLRRLQNFKGYEIDVYFRRDLNKLVVWHRGLNSEDPDIDFQCWKNQYVLFEDFLDYIESLHPHLAVWVDLKNNNSLDVYKSAKILSINKYNSRFIIETKRVLNILLLKFFELNTSLWLTKPYLPHTLIKMIGPNHLSQACSVVANQKQSFDFKSILCWNTNSKPLSKKELEKIKNLKIVLTP